MYLYFFKSVAVSAGLILNWLQTPMTVFFRHGSNDLDRITCCAWFFLAHLSRRLTGELIGYPWIRRPSVRPSSTFSNIFSSETAWPIKAKFYVEPPWEGGTKFI